MRYLGVVIDLRCKVAAKLKAFSRVRHFFTNGARRSFYLCFIQPVLEDGSNAYVHSLLNYEYDQLNQLSKRAHRLILGFPSRAHTEPIRQRFQFCSLDVRLNFKFFILVFRCVNNLASTLLQNMFNLRCTVTHTSRVLDRRFYLALLCLLIILVLVISGCRQVELLACLTSLYIFFNIIHPAASAAARVSYTSICWITLVI